VKAIVPEQSCSSCPSMFALTKCRRIPAAAYRRCRNNSETLGRGCAATGGDA
jgi:hypothetical protein